MAALCSVGGRGFGLGACQFPGGSAGAATAGAADGMAMAGAECSPRFGCVRTGNGFSLVKTWSPRVNITVSVLGTPGGTGMDIKGGGVCGTGFEDAEA